MKAQHLIVYAKSKKALQKIMDHLTAAFEDLSDSGEKPDEAYYLLSDVTKEQE